MVDVLSQYLSLAIALLCIVGAFATETVMDSLVLIGIACAIVDAVAIRRLLER